MDTSHIGCRAGKIPLSAHVATIELKQKWLGSSSQNVAGVTLSKVMQILCRSVILDVGDFLEFVFEGFSDS